MTIWQELQKGLIMKNKRMTTFNRIMKNTKQKKKFDSEYADFLFSELLLDAMNEQQVSVRELSKESGISTSIIQNIRAQSKSNLTLKTMESLLCALGYQLTAKKGRKTVNLTVLQ